MSMKDKKESLTESPSNDEITLHNNGWCYDEMAATYSEEYRHECEILSLVRMFNERGADKVKSFLLLVKKERGANAAERLRMETATRLGLGKKKR